MLTIYLFLLPIAMFGILKTDAFNNSSTNINKSYQHSYNYPNKFYVDCIKRNAIIQDFYLRKPRYPSLCKLNFSTPITIIENPKWGTNYEIYIKFKKYDDSSLFTKRKK